VNLVSGQGSGGDANGDRYISIENVTGSDFADTITGDGSDNLVVGGAGGDVLDGGAGNDTIDYSDSSSAIFVSLQLGVGSGGDANSDSVSNFENVIGSDYNDSIVGDGNDNLLSGGAGDDTLIGSTGSDTLEGGAGTDVADYSASASAVTVDLNAGTASGGDAEGDVLSGIEGVKATDFNDSLTGDASANEFDAGGGSDTVAGGLGNDTILGGDNNDTIDGGSGDDVIYGDGEEPRTPLSETVQYSYAQDITGGQANHFGEQGLGTANDPMLLIDGNEGTEARWHAGDIVEYSFGQELEAGTSITLVEGTSVEDGIVNVYVSYGSTDPNGDLLSGSGGGVGYENTVTNGQGILIYSGPSDANIELILPINATHIQIVSQDSHSGFSELVLTEDFTPPVTGDDSITGGDGNDTIDAGAGNDTVDGGADNDSIIGAAGADSLAGGTGNDTIDGGADNDTIDGGAGDDSLVGGAGADSVVGGTGNDTIDAGSGADTVIGGDGSDQIDLGAADGVADLLVLKDGGGNDVISSFEAPIDNGDGTYTAQDELDVSGLTDASGNPVSVEDVVVTDTNGDGTGDATLTFPGGESVTLVGVTVAEVQSFAQLEALGVPPAAGDFTVEGTAGSDLIDAAYAGDPEGDMVDNNDHSDGSNDDYIATGAGNDTVFAGEGDDTVHAQFTADANLFYGGAGNDVLNGGSGADTLFGGTGDDYLLPSGGSDQVFGEDGNDTIAAGLGSAYLDGGDGNDSISGGGSSDNDTIVGGAGDDTLIDGGGDALFFFGDEFGNDFLTGGESGETNGDVMDFSGVTGNISVLFTGDEAGDVTSGTNSVDFAEIEQIYLSGGNDSVDASASNSGTVVHAGAGNDTFVGTFGNDVVFGGDDNDFLSGGDGLDSIYGEVGDDTLLGGLGADYVLGGDGNDVIFAAEGDTVYGEDGDDLFILSDLGETGASAITIDGGTTSELGGDTLDLNGIADRTTLSFTPAAGDPDAFDGSVTLLDGTVVTFTNIENIICFTPGTMIATPDGERAVETLRPGDLVLTRDDGPQPLGWVGNSTVPGIGKYAPVRLDPTITGARRRLTVSPQHRMLIEDWRAELLFAEREVFVAARHLLDCKGAERAPAEMVTYIHLMFDRHQVIYAEGAPCESFHAAEQGLKALVPEARVELFAAYPVLCEDISAHGPTARLCLKAYESRALVSEIFALKSARISIAA
ncbi:Hint domain-containing protein, partial [Marimonas arenosa]